MISKMAQPGLENDWLKSGRFLIHRTNINEAGHLCRICIRLMIEYFVA